MADRIIEFINGEFIPFDGKGVPNREDRLFVRGAKEPYAVVGTCITSVKQSNGTRYGLTRVLAYQPQPVVPFGQAVPDRIEEIAGIFAYHPTSENPLIRRQFIGEYG